MSTTFEVYTPTMNIPSFGEILELSNIRFKEFLAGINIKTDKQINMVIWLS